MRQTATSYAATYPLARRMMLIVLLWSILFTLSTAAVQVLLDYRQEKSLLDERLDQIQAIQLPGLANSIWHFDNNQIDTQLQGMLNLQDVCYVEVQITGAETHSAGRNIPAAVAISQTFLIEYAQDGEIFTIGRLQVVADNRSLQQRVLGGLGGVLLSATVQIFLLAGFILFFVERLLTRPLNEIARYTETLHLDHLEEPLVLQPRKLVASRGDELDLVALKLNEMRCRLMEDMAQQKQMEAALRQSERNYREIFNATSEGIFIHDASNGQVLQVNTATLRLYGYTSETEVLGSTSGDFSSNETPYTEVEVQYYLQKALAEGPQVFEWRARKKTGELFWVEVSLRNSSIGGENRVLAVVRDITERKNAENLLLAKNEELLAQQRALEEAEAHTRQLNAELEKRVAERTLQLAAINQELEAFSYSVAHDLRAPLRHMDGFSQIIQEKYEDELNDDVKKRIQQIRSFAQNMNQMVDALLALSRVSRDELHRTSIDLSLLAQSIADDLRQREPKRKVEILIEPGLITQADKHLLRIMLENLLSNAWKFTVHRLPARIEIGHLDTSSRAKGETEQEVLYFVRDNGAGFDMAYADRLFIPFQRLHSASEFSGTGIGLATVRRIIQRHGGRIWAESAVDQGTTFYFTLP